jgi:hypothetical protein
MYASGMIEQATDTVSDEIPEDAAGPTAGESAIATSGEHGSEDPPPRAGFSLSITGGFAPISAITALDEGRIAIISDGVPRWLSPDGSLGGRIGGRPRCSGRAIALAGWRGVLSILFDDPPGLAVITGTNEYLSSFEHREMPVTGGIGLAMNATTIAVSGEDPKIYLFDRATMAIGRILRVPGVEHLAAAPDGAFWASIPRTGRLIRLGENGDLTDALSGFSRPGVPALSNSLAAVPDRETGQVMLKAIDPSIPSSVIMGEPLVSPTGVMVLPDGALLVSQEAQPYLLRYEPPR